MAKPCCVSECPNSLTALSGNRTDATPSQAYSAALRWTGACQSAATFNLGSANFTQIRRSPRATRAISEATPPWFTIDADWNDFLLDAPTALPVLTALEEEFSKIKIFEGPIPVDDIDGNRRLRSVLRTQIAHHYNSQGRHGAARSEHCDGYVIGGGITSISRAGHFAGAARMPFFLQMVGTGLTTSLCLHLGSVLASARWPAVTVHELYDHNLLTARIPVSGGFATVPTAPGLGVEVDESALNHYRVDQANLNLPRRLICYRRPSGLTVYFAAKASPESSMWNYFADGNQPAYERGVFTELIEDDGSSDFQRLYEQTMVGPVVDTESIAANQSA